jgi:hypothetical protein
MIFPFFCNFFFLTFFFFCIRKSPYAPPLWTKQTGGESGVFPWEVVVLGKWRGWCEFCRFCHFMWRLSQLHASMHGDMNSCYFFFIVKFCKISFLFACFDKLKKKKKRVHVLFLNSQYGWMNNVDELNSAYFWRVFFPLFVGRRNWPSARQWGQLLLRSFLKFHTFIIPQPPKPVLVTDASVLQH